MRPLLARIEALLRVQNAAPRLKAHLALVHEVACVLTDQLSAAWPMLIYEREAVLFGAASHDVGKILHPKELRQPGHAHEEVGRQLLLDNGMPESLARFAATHAHAHNHESPVEDILVALSDKIWKGMREDALEQALVHHITQSSGEELWQVWIRLDDILTDIAAHAAERLMHLSSSILYTTGSFVSFPAHPLDIPTDIRYNIDTICTRVAI